MYSEKKMSKEDTWRTEDLLKHMRGHRYDDASGNKRDHLDMDDNRKARRGESGDRRHRDQQKTSHKERDGTEGKSKHKDLDKGRHRNDTQGGTTHRDTEKDRDRDRTREKTRYRDLDREQDGSHERARHRDLERDREKDGTWERRRHKDLERDRDRDDGTRERRRHKDLERDRDRDDGTREKIRHRDLERDREQDGTRERRRHKDLERDREQHPRKDSRREKAAERDRREPERRQEWEGIEKRDYDKGHERAEKEHRKTEKRRAERDREYGEGRERERDREKDQERWKEKDGYKDQGWGHSIKQVKENDQSKDKVQGMWLEPPNEHRRHKDGQHSRQKEDKEYKEQRRKEKEERERRRREREQRESGESRRRDKLSGGDGEEVHREDVRRDRERRKDDRHRERRRGEDWDPENALAKLTAGSQRRSAQGHSEKPGFGRRHLTEPEAKIGDAEVSGVSSEKQGKEEGAEEYEEDFEDYEEDFEEADESDEAGGSDEGGGGGGDGEQMSAQERKEVEAIQRAMEAENRRLGSVQSASHMGECEEAGRDGTADGAVSCSRATQQGKFIDFVAAKHREMSKKMASKQKKRSTELLRLVDLDFSVTLSLLDLPPLTEYDMYIKSFGSTDSKQAYAQCREDDVDRDVQTEEVETCDRWTQHPADRGLVCGGPGLTSEASDKQTGGESLASQRLAAFLLSASQVMTVLLEEDRLERFSLCKPSLQRDALPFSDGSLHLGSGMPFLHGREVSLMVFSQTQRQTVLSVHRPSARPSAVHLDSKTILCIWNIWEPSCPQKILVYESDVSCCCFSPGKASLVFAGTAVGSLVLWDLREQSGLHCSIRIGEQDWTLRYPTFSTDAVLAASAHLSPVMALEPIPPSTAEAQRDGFPQLPWQEESSGMSFQLGSLDEKGVLNLWVVVELPRGDEAGSHINLGLRPGGKVKLLHSSAVTALRRSTPVEALGLDSIQSLLLKFHPSDSNHFYVGTDMNLVYRGTRHGLRSPPMFYRSQKGGLSPVRVTSLDFSPFDESIFLVACDDGSMRLHSVSSEAPIMEWSCGAGGSTLSARWSLTRPAVFCALDPAASIICMWDLLQKESEPVAMEKVHPDRITSMAVFGDPSKQNSFSGILLATHSGQLEIHYLSRNWTAPGQCELEQLQKLAGDVY